MDLRGGFHYSEAERKSKRIRKRDEDKGGRREPILRSEAKPYSVYSYHRENHRLLYYFLFFLLHLFFLVTTAMSPVSHRLASRATKQLTFTDDIVVLSCWNANKIRSTSMVSSHHQPSMALRALVRLSWRTTILPRVCSPPSCAPAFSLSTL